MPANHIKQPSSGALPTDGSNPLQLSKHLHTAIFKRSCLLFYCKKKMQWGILLAVELVW